MISVDTLEDNTRFAKEHEADYSILSDVTKEIANKYGVLGRAGFANRWTFYIGPDGKILDIDKKPGTQQAGQNVVARLKALGVKEKK